MVYPACHFSLLFMGNLAPSTLSCGLKPGITLMFSPSENRSNCRIANAKTGTILFNVKCHPTSPRLWILDRHNKKHTLVYHYDVRPAIQLWDWKRPLYVKKWLQPYERGYDQIFLRPELSYLQLVKKSTGSGSGTLTATSIYGKR